jgi:hypothetical protein
MPIIFILPEPGQNVVTPIGRKFIPLKGDVLSPRQGRRRKLSIVNGEWETRCHEYTDA